MELQMNSAVKAQLSTMPDDDQLATEAAFHRLAKEFPDVPDLRKVEKDGNLWEMNITPSLLALVRIESSRVEVLAVMRLEQLEHYRLRELPG